MSLAFEYLKSDAGSEICIRLNNYYMNDPDAQKVLAFDQSIPQDMMTLNRVINSFSRELIRNELEFIYHCDNNSDLRRITGFYENLARHFPDDSQGCILRLGWGSGWTSMTGNILNDFDAFLSDFREWFKMGRKGFLYPKSRKIVMRDRNPDSVPGWIKMEMI